MAKRIYIKGAPYLLTTNTRNKAHFFQEDIFCNIFIDVMAECQKDKPFNLLGFKINPDHVHLILQPTGDYNISHIMHNIKRVSSIHLNKIIHIALTKHSYDKFEWTPALKFHKRCFHRKYNYRGSHPFNSFDWQDGFDDKLIRSPQGLKNRVIYLENQVIKHNLPENKFLYINPDPPTDLFFIGESKK